MKPPKSKPGEDSPAGDGGRAMERLRLFEKQRGIVTKTPAENPPAPKKKPRRKSP